MDLLSNFKCKKLWGRSIIDIQNATSTGKILLCLVGYEKRCIMKRNEIKQSLLSVINNNESCFEPETSNNSSKKIQSDFVARQCSIIHCKSVKISYQYFNESYYTRIYQTVLFQIITYIF